MYKLTKKQCAKVADKAARGLFEYCRKYGIHFVVTGSSGGLDSAVTLKLAERACQLAKAAKYRLYSVGLIMPCESTLDAERLGRIAIKDAHAFEIKIDLNNIFSCAVEFNFFLIPDLNYGIEFLRKKTGIKCREDERRQLFRVARGNIKARLRMTFGTYHVARMLNGIVLSTDNLSEYWMAFWTLHGDVGDFGMIQNVMKGLELYDIARCLGVNEEILGARPDDGLGVGGGDEDQLGAPYSVIDEVMLAMQRNGFNPDGPMDQMNDLPAVCGVDQKIVKKLARRCLAGAYKRKGPIALSRRELGLPEIGAIKL